jgi:hypothetical protein
MVANSDFSDAAARVALGLAAGVFLGMMQVGHAVGKRPKFTE